MIFNSGVGCVGNMRKDNRSGRKAIAAVKVAAAAKVWSRGDGGSKDCVELKMRHCESSLKVTEICQALSDKVSDTVGLRAVTLVTVKVGDPAKQAQEL
jgi:hypothetical protein